CVKSFQIGPKRSHVGMLAEPTHPQEDAADARCRIVLSQVYQQPSEQPRLCYLNESDRRLRARRLQDPAQHLEVDAMSLVVAGPSLNVRRRHGTRQPLILHRGVDEPVTKSGITE